MLPDAIELAIRFMTGPKRPEMPISVSREGIHVYGLFLGRLRDDGGFAVLGGSGSGAEIVVVREIQDVITDA
jgi:hypothetical protein